MYLDNEDIGFLSDAAFVVRRFSKQSATRDTDEPSSCSGILDGVRDLFEEGGTETAERRD